MNPSSPSQDCHTNIMAFLQVFDGSGCTFFQAHQKPLTVMNVHNRARKHLRATESETWIDEIQKVNDREARAALPLSALIVG